MRRVHLRGPRIELQELRAFAQAFTLGKNRAGQALIYLEAMLTERRLRPFALLLLITSLPFLVAMRTRKPWVLFLEILLGWNVLFIFIDSLNVLVTIILKVSVELKHKHLLLSRCFSRGKFCLAKTG